MMGLIFHLKTEYLGGARGKGGEVSVAVSRNRDENIVFVLHPQDYSPGRIICVA